MYKKGRVNSNSRIISTDEDPSLRIESSAIINLRGVSTKLNKCTLCYSTKKNMTNGVNAAIPAWQTFQNLKECTVCNVYNIAETIA